MKIKKARLHGIAILESDDFLFMVKPEGFLAWPVGAIYAEAAELIDAAVPELLNVLRTIYPQPPPPGSPMAGAADRRAFAARWYIDKLLPLAVESLAEAPDWVRDWALFYRMDGTAVSLDHLLSRQELPIPCDLQEPWDGYAPEGSHAPEMLILSREQFVFLRKMMPHAFAPRNDVSEEPPSSPEGEKGANQALLSSVKARLHAAVRSSSSGIIDANLLHTWIDSVSVRSLEGQDLVGCKAGAGVFNTNHPLWRHALALPGTKELEVRLAVAVVAGWESNLVDARGRVGLVACLYED
jgi:hypothetical protein